MCSEPRRDAYYFQLILPRVNTDHEMSSGHRLLDGSVVQHMLIISQSYDADVTPFNDALRSVVPGLLNLITLISYSDEVSV